MNQDKGLFLKSSYPSRNTYSSHSSCHSTASGAFSLTDVVYFSLPSAMMTKQLLVPCLPFISRPLARWTAITNGAERIFDVPKTWKEETKRSVSKVGCIHNALWICIEMLRNRRAGGPDPFALVWEKSRISSCVFTCWCFCSFGVIEICESLKSY